MSLSPSDTADSRNPATEDAMGSLSRRRRRGSGSGFFIPFQHERNDLPAPFTIRVELDLV